jgi:hypothetical protein
VASSAYRILHQDRTYEDVMDVTFTVGGKLGTATQPACDDTGGQEKTLPTDTSVRVWPRRDWSAT